MGTYTEFYFKATLKKETPPEVITLLNDIVNNFHAFYEQLTNKEYPVIKSVADTPELPIEHPFGKCERWDQLFHSTDWGSINNGGSTFTNTGYPELWIHTQFKNYDNPIGKFVDWIKPHIAGRKKKQYLGFYQVETCEFQINIYIER
jgi:hypothetical protein